MIIEKIVDLETGEEIVIEREETEKEKIEKEKAAIELKNISDKMAEKEKSKSALLEKLGITEEEAKLLLS